MKGSGAKSAGLRESAALDTRRGGGDDFGTMKPLKTLRLVGAMALLPVSAQAAVLYNGFATSTPGNGTPQGWTVAGSSGTGTSNITAAHHLAMTAASTSVFTHYNTTSGITRSAGQGFKLTSTFSATSGTGQFENTGFYFMNSSDGNTSGPRILFNMGSTLPGTLEFAGTTGNSNGSLANYASLESQGAIYTLTLTGIFNASNGMDLTATLTNSVDGSVVTSTASLSSVAAGNNYFGIRTASSGGTGPSASATHQSYLLESIPEPSHALLVALGGLGMIARRRRKA